MPDILLNRETVILTAPSDALFPRNDLYPADDLYPYGEVREVTNIVAGSLKLDSLLAEKSIQFGQFYATKFEVQVYNEEDLSGRYIHVYQREGNVYHDLFTGVIDSCKVDKIGTDRTIVAYDKAYVTRQMNVADFWNSYWTIEEQTATLKQVRDALLGYYGIPYEDVTLPNDNLVVSKNVDFTSCSLQQLLGSICELNCCLPHFNGNGYLEFIMLDTEATPVDISGKYEWMNSDFQDYITAPISGIQFFDSDDQLKYTYGSADNAYPIKKNVFLYNADDTTLNSVASVMMNYLQDLSYTPASLKMIVGSFDIKLGDYVHTERGDFFVLQNSYSGSQFVEQTIKADGDEQSYGGTEDLDYGEIILNQKYARVSKDLSDFIVEYGKEQTATTTKIDGIFANYTSEDAVDYAPSVSSPPASTWVNPDTRKNHLGELFYDTVNKKYYEWQKTSDTPTYNWIQVPSYAHNYSMVSSRFQVNESAISSEVDRATKEESRIEEDNYEAFANYVGAGAPTQSWSGDTRLAHAGEIYYDKTAKKYYVYTLTYNTDGSIKTAGWVQQNINKRYDLVTTTSNSKMEQTSTSFSVAINTERNERHSETAKSFCNYSSKSSNTSDAPARAVSGSDNWSTSTKKANAGKIYYNETTGHYWRWVVEVNSEGSITKAEWKDEGEVTNRYNLVTETTDSKLSLTSNQFSVSLNSEISTRKNEDLKLTYSYTGTSAPSSSYKPWPNTDLDRDHVGEIYYDSTNKEYYVYEKTGTNTYAWTQRIMSTPFSSTTRSNSAMLNLAEDEFSVTLEQSERELFANYTGTGTPGKPWSDADSNHVGEVYYREDTDKYYIYQKNTGSKLAILIYYATEGGNYDYLDVYVPVTDDFIPQCNVYRLQGTSSGSYNTKTLIVPAPEDGEICFHWVTDVSGQNYYGYKIVSYTLQDSGTLTPYDEMDYTDYSTLSSYQSESAHNPYNANEDKWFKYNLPQYQWVEVTDSTKPFKVVSSQIKQTVDNISLKVSKEDVVSEINVSSDAIQLNTAGRLLITAGNFQLDSQGNVTANGATLTGGVLEVTKEGEEITIIDLDTGDEVTYDDSVHFKVSEAGITWQTEYSKMSEDGIFTSGADTGKQIQLNDGKILFYRNGTNYGEIFSGKRSDNNDSAIRINTNNLQISTGLFIISNTNSDNVRITFNENGNLHIYNTASGHRSLTTSRGITVQSDGIEATGDSWFKNELKARTLKVTDGTSVVWSGNTLTGWSGHFQTKSGNTVYVRYGIITSVEDNSIIIES